MAALDVGKESGETVEGCNWKENAVCLEEVMEDCEDESGRFFLGGDSEEGDAYRHNLVVTGEWR